MKPLRAELEAALANLGRKKAGEQVGWISIAAAQGLVEAGLARRTRSGWELTPEGADRLAEDRSRGQSGGAVIMNFANDEEIPDHGRP